MRVRRDTSCTESPDDPRCGSFNRRGFDATGSAGKPPRSGASFLPPSMTALRELKPSSHAPAAQAVTVVLVKDHVVPGQAKSRRVLSRREREILGLLANGMHGAAIARAR